jgi:hypothetical protein
MYRYYQKIGGTEPWQVTQASTDFSSIRPTFITVLAVDLIITPDMERQQLETLKYQGPMYIDLDNDADISESIADGKLLWEKLKAHDVQADDVEIYLSGKKGLHFLIPQEVFMQRPACHLQRDRIQPCHRFDGLRCIFC